MRRTPTIPAMTAALVSTATSLIFYPVHSISQERQTLLRLPYGISVAVPKGWRSDREEVTAYLAGGKSAPGSVVNIRPDESGHLLILAGPLSEPGEASLQISIRPTRVSQAEVGTLSPTNIQEADRTFHSDIENSARREGITVVAWHGTTRERLGGRLALVSRYRFRYPNKLDMQMESYGVYLGARSIHLRLQYPVVPTPGLQRDVDQIRRSIRLAADAL